MEEPAGWCYNLTAMKNQNTEKYNTPIQLKLPVDMARIIKISDPVYSFNEIMEHMDLNKYFAEEERKTDDEQGAGLFQNRGFCARQMRDTQIGTQIMQHVGG